MAYLPAALGVFSAIALALVQVSSVIPLEIIPTVNLMAIIAGSISMGMLFNRVTQLERRVDDIEDKP